MSFIDQSNVVHFFHPNGELYGSDRILVEVMRWALEKGKKVCLHLPLEGRNTKLDSFVQNKFPDVTLMYVSLPILKKKNFGLKLFGQWLGLFQYVKKNTDKGDVIYVNTIILCLLPFVFKFCGRTVCYHLHEASLPLSKWALSVIYFLISNFSKKVLCVSHHVGKTVSPYMLKKEFAKIKVIQNGIAGYPLQKIKQAEKPYQLYMIGKFTPNKGQRELLQCFRKCSALLQRAYHLHLIGDWNESDEMYYEKMREEASLMENVFVHKFQNNLQSVYEKMDALVLYSKEEAFPTVVLEAMSASKPVIATYCGGAEEQVQEGKTGFLLVREDSESLERVLSQFLNNPNLFSSMGREAQTVFDSHYQLKSFHTRLDSI